MIPPVELKKNKTMKKLILIPFLALAFIAAICSKGDDTSSSDDIKKKELELKEKELKLKEKELDMQKQSQGSLNTDGQTGDNTAGGNTSRYPQASDRLLTREDVENMDAWELKIMRNEIFARYGYIFKSPEMRDYFKYEKWYVPTYDNVDNMLTDVEKKNIELIKRYESRLGTNNFSR